MAFQLTSPPHTQFADPTILLSHFIRQIEGQHVQTSTQDPIMLHFNSRTKCLVEYGWPVDPITDERIPPNQLEAHRRSHEFRGPSCLCAFLEDRRYTEAEIGIVEVSSSEEERSKVILNGEYVAICAKRHCGFFLCLERFYALPNLKEESHRLRDKPLALDRLVYVSDVGKLYRRGDGLFQIMPDIVAQGRVGGLQTVDPAQIKAVRAEVVADLMLGVPEEVFWGTFVQCLGCNKVQFRQHYELNHQCPSMNVRHSNALRTPRPHPYRAPTENHSRKAKFHTRMTTLIGDTPAQRPMESITMRARLPARVVKAKRAHSPFEDGYDSDYAPTDVSGGYGDSPTTKDKAREAFLSGDALPLLGDLFAGRTLRVRSEGEEDSGPDCDPRGAATGPQEYWPVDEDSGPDCDLQEAATGYQQSLRAMADNTFRMANSATTVALEGVDKVRDDSGHHSEGPENQPHAWSKDGLNEDVQALSDPKSGYSGDSEKAEEAPDAISSDDVGPPGARTSDMEKWPSVYDSMFDTISRINGPQNF